MRALIDRLVRSETGLTACGLVAAALMVVGVGAWLVAPIHHVVASAQINPLEMMANAKDLPTSFAMASSPPAMGARPPAAGAMAGNPGASGPTFQTGNYGARHHASIYMSAKSIHKHKQLKRAAVFPDLTQRPATGNVN